MNENKSPKEKYCSYCGSEKITGEAVCTSCGVRYPKQAGVSVILLLIFPVLFLTISLMSAHSVVDFVVRTAEARAEKTITEKTDCEICTVECGGTCVHIDGVCGCVWIDYSGDPDSAFAQAVRKMYGVIVIDNDGFLSNPDNIAARTAMENTLSLFSPSYIQSLTDFYASIGARFVLCIEEGDMSESNPMEFVLGQFVISEDSPDATITLYYYPDIGVHGVNSATLAHELGHAIHYNIRYMIGDSLFERALAQHNDAYEYVGHSYSEEWDYVIHASTFAYAYGMCDYGEDVATIFERLVDTPDGMRARLIDPSNRPLYNKILEIRELTYKYVNDDPCSVFAPLYYAEQYLGG